MQQDAASICMPSGATVSAFSPASTAADDSFITVRFAARLAPNDDCDIIVLYVRPVDQGLWSGGLQVRLARQNMMEAGFELPGVRDLKKALDILKEEGIDAESWPREASQQDAWGDPGRRHQGRIPEPGRPQRRAQAQDRARCRPTAFSINMSSAPTIS